MFLLPLLPLFVVSTSDIPLAPYNVKIDCRQGLRFTRHSQTAQQCPSSATACGYLEFSSSNKSGIDSTGIFDCVESGMLKDDEEEDDYSDEPPGNVLFAQLCGSQASCSSLRMNQLNPAFLRYLVMQHGIKLEELQDHTLRFCCSLFHATLQKLIVSGADRLPTASASSVHCKGESCSAGAVGCLSHTRSSDSEEYDDKFIRKRRRRRQNEEEDDYGINAVEISFEDEEGSLVLVSRETTPSPPLRNKTNFLPSLNLPLVPPKSPPTKIKNGVKYAVIDEDDDEDEESGDEEEHHCVYRHLNDELYRWCLFVHQSKTGDRCYHHQGHTVCCCFAPPDTDTCDPTEMELVIPGRRSQARLPPIIVTPRPIERKTTTPTSKTTTTTTTSTTTTEEPTTSTTTTSTTTTTTPVPSTTVPRCRVTYTRTKGRRTPVLVCGSGPVLLSLLGLSIPVFLLFQL